MAEQPNKWRQAGPWMGIATAPAALMLGGSVAEQVSVDAFFWALLIGAAVVILLSTLQGRLGVIHQKPLVLLARPVLGDRVARWSNTVLISILMLGWSGFGFGVVGESLAKLFAIPEIFALLIWAAIMLAVLWKSIHHGSLYALISSLATLALVAWGIFQISGIEPVTSVESGKGTFFSGIGLVIGYASAFSLRSVDFTQNIQHTRYVFWTAIFGMGFPLMLVMISGAWMYHFAGTWDLSQLLTDLGFPMIAHIFVAIGFLGAGVSNMHSGSLALQDLLRWPRQILLFFICGVSIVLALLDFDKAMVEWLKFLALVVVPLIGVILTHYAMGSSKIRQVNWSGLIAWGVGAIAGILIPEIFPKALISILIAAATYAILEQRHRGRSA